MMTNDPHPELVSAPRGWGVVEDPEARAAAFDPNQPRDEQGRWTDAFGTQDPHVYHLTDPDTDLASFAQQGIRPSEDGYGGPGVYMANRPEGTEYYHSLDEGQLLRVDKAKLIEAFGIYPAAKDGVQFDDGTGEIILPGDRAVPPGIVQFRTRGGEWADLPTPTSAYLKDDGSPSRLLKRTIAEWQSNDRIPGKIRQEMKKVLRETLPGGALAHLRPPSGITLYRGSDRGSAPSSTPKSWSSSKKMARGFGPAVQSITVDDSIPALDLDKFFGKEGASEHEVILAAPGSLRSAEGIHLVGAADPLPSRYRMSKYAGQHAAELVAAPRKVRIAIRNEVRKALRNGEGPEGIANRLFGEVDMPPERIDTIARTEYAFARTAARLEEAAAEFGDVDLEKTWRADPDCCDMCAAMDGQTVAVDEPFQDPKGGLHVGSPAHPNCRCDIEIREVAAEEALDEQKLRAAGILFIGAEFDESKHPRDEKGRFTTSGYLAEDTEENLPIGASTEADAEKTFKAKLQKLSDTGALTFHHEAPGDALDSFKSKGILGDYGIFSSVNYPSGFVKGLKTEVEFGLSRDDLDYVTPDMKYVGQVLQPHQLFLKSTYGDMTGGYVSHSAEQIPASAIKRIRVRDENGTVVKEWVPEKRRVPAEVSPKRQRREKPHETLTQKRARIIAKIKRDRFRASANVLLPSGGERASGASQGQGEKPRNP